MKMQAKRPAFVDVPYAKFYALSVSYCVWDPSAIAPLQDLIPSILPKQLRGERAAGVSSGTLIVPDHAPLRGKEFLDPGVRIHHGRKP